MTKLREPGSIKDALKRCIDALGGCTVVAKRLSIPGHPVSERIVAYWTDEDDDRYPNALRIVEIDRMAEASGLGRPISAALADAINAGSAMARPPSCPYRNLAAIQALLGVYAASLNDAMTDGTLDRRERREQARQLHDLRDEIDRALMALDTQNEPRPAALADGKILR